MLEVAIYDEAMYYAHEGESVVHRQSPNSQEFWHDTRVLITGGAGFLGSAVVATLHRRRASNLVVPHSTRRDLRHLPKIERFLTDTTPEAILRLAASAGSMGANYEQPADSFYENLMTDVQSLHKSPRHRVSKFVAVPTVCAYQKHTPVPFRGNDLWNSYPEDTKAPYELAKKLLLAQAQAYRHQFNFNAINVLPVNLYGPRDNVGAESSHVIPALIKKCMEAPVRGDATIDAWGDGSSTREFLYVEDAADAIIVAAERYDGSEPVNLGSAEENSIGDLTEAAARVTGSSGTITWDPSKPNGQSRRRLDVSRTEHCFGFCATTPFGDGLTRTTALYETARAQTGVSVT